MMLERSDAFADQSAESQVLVAPWERAEDAAPVHPVEAEQPGC